VPLDGRGGGGLTHAICQQAKQGQRPAQAQAGTPCRRSGVAALKKFKGPKFDQTINVCMFLGVDPKQADQNLRGSVALPKGIGKTKRVVAFCQSDVSPKAMAAGA
jgi:ribosomal protein L1